MRSKRAGLRLGAALLGIGLVASACGGGFGGGSDKSGGSKDLNLLVPSYSDATKGLWQGIISDFEKKNPDIKVNLEVESWDDINDVVRTKVQSNKAPDILNIDAFAGFAGDHLLYKASDVVSKSVLDDFQPAFAQNASIGGTQYGLPLIASSRTLFANTDLMKKAGISSPPKTWDQLLTDSKKISALGGGVSGYGMPLGSEEVHAETSIWLFGDGGSWSDGSKITVDTPQAEEAVSFMKKMIDAGATQKNPGSTDRTPLLNVFAQGKIGFIEGLPPIVGQIKKSNPKLNYELAPIPTKTGSAVTLGVADHLMAFKNDGKKKASIKKFLDYFYSPEVYLKWVTTEHFLPVTKSGAAQFDDASLKPFLATLPKAKFYPSTNPAWSATQGALQSLIGQIGQGKSPQSVLKQIQAKADAAG